MDEMVEVYISKSRVCIGFRINLESDEMLRDLKRLL